MGDRTWAGISFAGIINEEDVDDLLEACEADGLCCDSGPETRTLVAEHLKYELYNEEANYGQLETVQSYCQENGISYCMRWYEGGDYGPGMEIYNAVVGQTFTCGTIEGEPAVTLSDLEKAGSPEDLIGYLKAFNNFEENYGALEILELPQPPVTGEGT